MRLGKVGIQLLNYGLISNIFISKPLLILKSKIKLSTTYLDFCIK